jgi:ornithine cyclodeaminase/alanine dehydrogenase-like protein (mu-crystallin family)
VCLLYDDETGDLLAVLEASKLGQMRTGAASGLATRVMAREDATVVGMIGTGRQARSQIAAVCAVRPISLVRAYSRNEERRAQFAREMAGDLGVEVRPVGSGEEAVRGADIVITMTNTKEPVLHGAWLEPGTHVNAAGQNQVEARELDVEAVRRADVIAADAVDGAQIECGDLVTAVAEGAITWDRVVDFGKVLVGAAPGRTGAAQISLFESQGLCAEDMAGAARVYRCALEQGRGTEIPMFRGR